MTSASSNPFRVGSRGWGTLVHQNHAAGEENGSIMVGMFVSLCLASNKSSEREFFDPARTHLGVKLLTASMVQEGTKNSRSLGPMICAVGILREFHRQPTQLPQQTSSPWCSFSPLYSVVSMDRPDPTHGRPSDGVERGF